MATVAALEPIVDRAGERDGWSICSQLACVNHEWCGAVAHIRSLMHTVEIGSNNSLYDHDLRHAVKMCPSLQCIRVGNTASKGFVGGPLSQHITDAGLQMVASAYGSGLKEMTLAFCDGLSLLGWLALARNCPMLETLCVTGTRLDNDSLFAVAVGCPRLVTIDILIRSHLMKGELSSVAIRQLNTMLHKLETLRIREHWFEEKHCMNLTWPELVRLDLSACFNMTGEALATGQYPKLQELNLDDHWEGDLVASHLRKALKRMPCLTSVSLDGVKAVGDVTARTLRDHCQMLSFVCMSETGIGDDGVVALSGLPRLTKVHVSARARRQLGEIGLLALANAPQMKSILYNGCVSPLRRATLMALTEKTNLTYIELGNETFWDVDWARRKGTAPQMFFGWAESDWPIRLLP